MRSSFLWITGFLTGFSCNYFVPMVTKIVSIGNSRGIRIPKAMLENCGFGEEAELVVKNGALVLSPVKAVRAGWSEAFGGSGIGRIRC